MPRTARASAGNVVYHVINRGNCRMRVFHRDADYAAFVRLLADAGERSARREGPAMRLLAYCLMPTHFHLVLWPRHDGDLSRWMQWLLTAHVRRYHRVRDTSGHVWQGRFKAFPIQQDEHLLSVLRYVERNPLRAGLVSSAEQWRWSSLGLRSIGTDSLGTPRPSGSTAGRARGPGLESRALSASVRPGAEFPPPAAGLLHPWPVARPRNWPERVNAAETDRELEQLRRSVERGAPLGASDWTKRTAARLGLESTLRHRGRPRNTEK